MKKCSGCNLLLDFDKFRKDKHNKDGLDYYCKICKSSKEKHRHQMSPEIRKGINDRWKDKRRKYYSDEDRKRKYKDLELQRTFGITIDSFEELLSKQKGVCSICKDDEKSIRNKHLAVDHDHTTGKVRGLLCSNCNRAIGLLKDNIQIIRRAAEYLEEFNENE